MSLLVPDSCGPYATCLCKSCGYKTSSFEIVNYVETIFNAEKSAGVNSSHDPAVEESFLKRHLFPNGLFHKNLAVVVYVKIHLGYDIYGHAKGYLLSDLSDDQLNRKLELCQELLELFAILDPGLSEHRARFLKEWLETALEKCRRISVTSSGPSKQKALALAKEAECCLPDLQLMFIEPHMQNTIKQLCQDSRAFKKTISEMLKDSAPV